MEYAIFNTNAELITSTDTYVKEKGQKVHAPSINEVISQGNILVSKPGLMNSCYGCRFANNCPSKIEILSCLKLNSKTIGVISLTSFSDEGHNVISQNIHTFSNILQKVCDIIAIFIYNKASKKDTYLLQKALNYKTKNVNQHFLIINNSGKLLHWNDKLEDLFSYCDLYSQTIDQILPKNIVSWLFSKKIPSKKYIHIENLKGILYIQPLEIHNQIHGYILEIENKNIVANKSKTKKQLDSIISINPKIEKIKKSIIKISNSPTSVLITGDTGTGKEMVAKAIHYQSNRADKPFIPINCANIPESLFESELFGYEGGAFTGAKQGGKLGLFEAADSGTVFLDEIGELTLYQQAKLLRVLQEHSIQRIGDNKVIPLDIRVISSTNRNLTDMMEKGSFRSDLYYRINVIPIHLPPLTERIDDISILTEHFIKKYNKILNKNIHSISQDALNLLKSYSWPGNIRELQNTIEYACNMETSKNIQPHNLPPIIKNTPALSQKQSLEDNELQFIYNTLNKNGWDLKGKEKTAEDLGISLRTLYRKIEKIN